MKRIHLLRVEAGPERFAPLLEAAAAGGLRLGWLELVDVEAPAALSTALGLGVAKAVAAGPRLTVSAKRRRGPAVIEDLIRGSFLGCTAVLVKGEVGLPLLQPEEQGWKVSLESGRKRHLQTAELLDSLRQPRPFWE